MITSQQSEERLKISKARKYNVNAYIVKPFLAETLREKVFQVMFGNSNPLQAILDSSLGSVIEADADSDEDPESEDESA